MQNASEIWTLWQMKLIYTCYWTLLHNRFTAFGVRFKDTKEENALKIFCAVLGTPIMATSPLLIKGRIATWYLQRFVFKHMSRSGEDPPSTTPSTPCCPVEARALITALLSSDAGRPNLMLGPTWRKAQLKHQRWDNLRSQLRYQRPDQNSLKSNNSSDNSAWLTSD